MTKLLHAIKTSKTRSKGGLSSLYTSVFGVFLCIGCLAGVTWAWFSMATTVDDQVMVAANSAVAEPLIEERYYTVTAAVVDENGDEISAGDRKTHYRDVKSQEKYSVYSFGADSETVYQVSCNMIGTAERQLLIIETPDGNYFAQGKNVNFELLLENSGKVKIYASWGEDTGDAEEITKGKSKKFERIGNGVEYIPEIPVVVQESEEDGDDTASSSGSAGGGGESSGSGSAGGGESSGSGASSGGGESSGSGASSGGGESSGSGASSGGGSSSGGSSDGGGSSASE